MMFARISSNLSLFRISRNVSGVAASSETMILLTRELINARLTDSVNRIPFVAK
jgi:hypothetical protein